MLEIPEIDSAPRADERACLESLLQLEYAKVPNSVVHAAIDEASISVCVSCVLTPIRCFMDVCQGTVAHVIPGAHLWVHSNSGYLHILMARGCAWAVGVSAVARTRLF